MNVSSTEMSSYNSTSSETPLSDTTTLFEHSWDGWEHYYNKTASLYHNVIGIAQVLVCVIGFIANLLSITVLSMTIRRSKLPVYRCFLGLAIADLMAVTFTLVNSATMYSNPERILVDDYDMSKASAESIGYNVVIELARHFMNFAFCASNWCVVAMSSLRCIAVFRPMWYQRRCTAKLVNILILVVYVFSFVVVVPEVSFTTFNATSHRFEYNMVMYDNYKEKGFHPKIISVIMVVMMQFLPLITTAVLLVPLVWKLCSHSAIERAASNAKYRSKDKMQSSITLVGIAIFFLICVTPTIVFYSTRNFQVMRDTPKHLSWKDQYNETRIFIAVQFLVTINYTANFFLYILLNARLRRRLQQLLCCSSEGKRACITQQTSLSVIKGQSGKEANGSSVTNNWNNSNSYISGRQSTEERRKRMRSRSTQKTDLSNDRDRQSLLTNTSSKSVNEADYNKNIATPNNLRTYFTNSQSLSNIEERSADTIEESTNLLRQNDDKSKRSGSESSDENDQVTFDT